MSSQSGEVSDGQHSRLGALHPLLVDVADGQVGRWKARYLDGVRVVTVGAPLGTLIPNMILPSGAPHFSRTCAGEWGGRMGGTQAAPARKKTTSTRMGYTS